ncbi:MAG: hypothetical protein AAF594_17125 [Bacteroidota bacterium]
MSIRVDPLTAAPNVGDLAERQVRFGVVGDSLRVWVRFNGQLVELDPATIPADVLRTASIGASGGPADHDATKVGLASRLAGVRAGVTDSAIASGTSVDSVTLAATLVALDQGQLVQVVAPSGRVYQWTLAQTALAIQGQSTLQLTPAQVVDEIIPAGTEVVAFPASSETPASVLAKLEQNADARTVTVAEKASLASLPGELAARPTAAQVQTVAEEESQNAAEDRYTDEEKAKLAGLDDTRRFLGTYATEGALIAAQPTAEAGQYAHVNGGVGVDTLEYVWDTDDGTWVAGSVSAETGATIKTKLEGEPDTNTVTDAEKTAIGSIGTPADNAVTTPKIADGAVTEAKLDSSLGVLTPPSSGIVIAGFEDSEQRYYTPSTLNTLLGNSGGGGPSDTTNPVWSGSAPTSISIQQGAGDASVDLGDFVSDDTAVTAITAQGSLPAGVTLGGSAPWTLTVSDDNPIPSGDIVVRAFDAAGNIADQTITIAVTASPPAAPSNVVAVPTAAGGGQVFLAWTNPDEVDLDEVAIHRQTAAIFDDLAADVVHTLTGQTALTEVAYIDDGTGNGPAAAPVVGTEYFYFLVAVKSDGTRSTTQGTPITQGTTGVVPVAAPPIDASGVELAYLLDPAPASGALFTQSLLGQNGRANVGWSGVPGGNTNANQSWQYEPQAGVAQLRGDGDPEGIEQAAVLPAQPRVIEFLHWADWNSATIFSITDDAAFYNAGARRRQGRVYAGGGSGGSSYQQEDNNNRAGLSWLRMEHVDNAGTTTVTISQWDGTQWVALDTGTCPTHAGTNLRMRGNGFADGTRVYAIRVYEDV